MKKKLFILIGLVILAGAFYAYSEFNRTKKSVSTLEAKYKSTAADLVSSFSKDEEGATKKYADAVIEVSGQIALIDNQADTLFTIYLETNDLAKVACELEKNQTINGLEVGQNVTVKGICSGYLMDVILVQSVLTK